MPAPEDLVWFIVREALLFPSTALQAYLFAVILSPVAVLVILNWRRIRSWVIAESAPKMTFLEVWRKLTREFVLSSTTDSWYKIGKPKLNPRSME